jgi:hypothetical protein
MWAGKKQGCRIHNNIIFETYVMTQCKGSNCKQIARWQHISQLRASAFCIFVK